MGYVRDATHRLLLPRRGNTTTMYLRYLRTDILKRERSEEEKLRRHLHGDKGAKFSAGKIPCIDRRGVVGAITTMVTKDLLLIETYEQC